MHRSNLLPLAATLLLVLPPISQAATPAPTDELEEVLVTGTLRAQAAQATPASVTVLESRTLQEAGQQHLQDVLALVPNLNWAAGTSRPRYFQVRGVGEREQYEGAPNPSVGFLIDDIDFSGLGMPATLFDLQQVEVLRGPQGTRYGANALAGLVVVKSRDPDRDPGFRIEAGGGDYGTREAGFSATGPMPVLDSAWRLAVQKYESDGFLRNAALGRDDTNGRDELTARLKWHGRLGEATALHLTLLHSDIDNGYDAWSLDNTRVTMTNQPGMDEQRADAASVRLESATFGSNTLTALAGYARSKTRYGYDYDWGNAAFWQPFFYEGAEQWNRVRRTGSAELRLASPEAIGVGDVAWLIGAYGLRLEEDGRYDSAGEYLHDDPADPFCAPWCDWNDTRLIDDRYHATNLALFGQLDGRLTRDWRWSAGLRLEQRRSRYRDAGDVNGTAQLSDFRARNHMLGGQVALSRDLGQSAMAYALLSRGYKAGGFNLGAVPDELRRFGPEYLWNLESGLKTSLGGGRGTAEVAVFYQRRRDQQSRSGRQLQGGGPYEFVTTNLPKGYSAGVEASLQYPLLPQWSVGASLGLLRTRTGATVNADGDPVASRASAHAPPYTAAVNLTWRNAAGFFARVDATAMDAFYFDVPTDHDQRSSAYGLVHFKAGYEGPRWSANAWLRNAFDQRYAVRGFYFGNDPRIGWDSRLYEQLGDPRQFGVTVSLAF